MTSRKYNRIASLSSTRAYPATFRARIAAIPDALKDRLTAMEIALIIDSVQHASFSAGYWQGQSEAQ